MNNRSTRRIPTFMDEDGVPTGRAVMSPVENTQRSHMVVPGRTVVPVVFVPGIMGSNLRRTTDGTNVWDADSQWALWSQWHKKGPADRQKLLDPETTEVDPNGEFYGDSATVPNEAVARDRGWGTASQSFYGNFVLWLDNALNPDFGETGTDESPWRLFEDALEWESHRFDTNQAATIDSHHTERPFVPLAKQASRQIWNTFFCPVHVTGYNWLQSNGQSGKYLASEIDKIIGHWNAKQGYTCQQVILVTHSMGGLTARAAVHEQFGKAKDKVAGIVHGELPANGAAAAYYHCRSGYGFPTSGVMGENAAEVTAVFANSPGALELLPNHQYRSHGDKAWLQAQTSNAGDRLLALPEVDPYSEIYTNKDQWWRLTNPGLIDPNGSFELSWDTYTKNLYVARAFHYSLAMYYHPQSYVHYGADKNFSTFGDLVWQTIDPDSWGWGWFDYNPVSSIAISKNALHDANVVEGSDPVTVRGRNGRAAAFTMKAADTTRYDQPGDGTVPACSGEAPNLQGGSAIQQSFRLSGFEHSTAYDNEHVRQATLYSIGKILEITLDEAKQP